MKLLRYGPAGAERPGLLDREGRIRDLGGIVHDIAGTALAPSSLERIAALDPETLPLAEGNPRIGPCVGRPSNFIAIGLNYEDHARESNLPIPSEPILFNKAPNCIVGPNDDVILPLNSTKGDWEVELALVVGTRAAYVSEAEAPGHIAGYCLCNDVSERSFQIERNGQWVKGKSAATFGPLGPWLVTADEISSPQDIDLWLDVNGQRMQTGSTQSMIFGIYHLLSYVSQFMVLEPGDIITTGTPPGVGMGRNPQIFLRPGDEMTLGGTGLGSQRQRVEAYHI
ncbi:fumarylacetoacetate hydrolase family protein [Mesorhizobium australicum]|uniref:fumarylacetoacetate hydrolase family protein n=1 Tax=Mesorhizobium australicum TaxID=536018 RepID=UPI00333D47E2